MGVSLTCLEHPVLAGIGLRCGLGSLSLPAVGGVELCQERSSGNVHSVACGLCLSPKPDLVLLLPPPAQTGILEGTTLFLP